MATSSDRVLDALRASLKESDRLRQHNQQLTEASWAPIAIVGMGCRFPGGVTSPDELWDLVAAGRDAITEFPDDRGWGTILSGNEGSYVRAGGFVEQTPCFDSGFFGISPREALAMDPQQRMLLEVTWETLEQAGIDPADLRGSKTGVFAGGTHSGYAVGVAGTEGTGGYLLTGSLAAVISGRVAYSLGLEGPAVTVDTACSSSLVAIHLACQSLRSGESSMALAGGVTVLATPDSFADFAQQGGLAPDGRCKAFASAANGIAWSEGAGMFLLERLTDARRNGHPVLAVIRGSAINQDGASNGLTAPNGPSQQRVIRTALSNARLSADDVDAVEAHGTGTTLGDPIEAQALLATYGRDRAPDRPLWLGSVKSNFAHTGAAAGAAGLMKMVQALRHRELPRTLHVDEPTARVDWSAGQIELLTEPRPWLPDAGDAESKARPRRAGVSSFGISGTNAHLIVEEAPPESDSTMAGDGPSGAEASGRRTDPSSGGALPNVLSGPCVAWALSARSTGALAGQARRLGARVDGDPSVDLVDVGWSLAATRTVFERRAVVVEAERAGLLTGLVAVAAGEPAAGVVSGVAAVRGPTVFVFPGQGSQWLGMGRELIGASPVFAARLAECERALEPHVDWSLGAVLAGEPDAPGLDRVDVVQPALWAVMVSLAAVWQAAGVRPDAVVGHSQGEIAAAVVAGILGLDDAAKVVALRSQALTALSGLGGMASIGAPLEQVEARLTVRPGVAVAAVNGPDATVVSGDLADLRELLGECERDGVRARLLPVDYASHGPQVEGIRGQVLGALSGIVPGPASVPMVSAMTGELLAGPEADADYWYASLRAPVQFDRAVRALRASGHGVFVEVSAHPVLTAAISDTLDDVAGSGPGADPVVTGTLRRDDGGAARVLASLAELWVNGVAVDWPGVLVGGSRVELPTYAFERQRFWPASLSGGAGDVRSAGLDSIGHPLLGAAVELADGDARVVTGRLSVRAQPWLGEHVVGGFPFFPGTGYVELAVVAGHLVGCTRVEELTLAAPLVLPPDTEVQVQITVGNPDQDGLRELEIYARPQDAGADWVRYASGQIGPCGSPAEQDTTDFTVWPPSDATATDIGGLYEALAEAGQDYGPAFQGLSAVWERGEDIFVEVASPEDVDTGAAAFGIHPTVLDATLHAVWMKLLDEGAQMPFVWSEVSLFASGATSLRARLRRGPNGAVSLLAVDGAGAPVISVGRLALRPVPSAAPASADQPAEEALFGVEWSAIPDTDSTTAPVAETGPWVVVGADSLGVVEGLVAGGVEPEVHPDLSVLADAATPVPGVLLTAVGTGDVDRTEDGDQGRAARRLTNEMVALLQQWLSLDSLADTRLVVVTRGAVAVRPGEGVADLAAAGVWGLVRSAQTENPGRLLLVDLPTDPGADLVGLLTEALSSPEPELAVRDGQAYGRRLVRPTGLVTDPETTDTSVPAEESGAAEEPGAVLVTGGTGTLGGLTARHLAATGRARHLLLVSRSGPMAASTGAGPAEVASAVAEAGADVHIVAADTGDRVALSGVVAGLPVGCPLTGVIHTAGIVDDGVVGSLTPERVDAVMRPKTDTAWNLHELTAGHPVEHFVMFSSTAAVFGGGGQGNYAAGNAFLDGLAAHRRAVGLPGLSLAWGAWVAEIGIGRNLSASQLAQVNSGGNFGADEGLAVLDLALTRDEALLVPSRIDVATLRVAASRGQALPRLLHTLSGPIRPVISSAANAAPDTSILHQQLAGAPESERDRILTQLVRAQAAAVLGHPSPEAIEPARAFTELGFDSLTAVDLRNRLNQATGLRLPATLVFDYPSPAALSQHIGKQLSGVLDDVVPIPVTPIAATTDDPIVIVGMGCRFPGGVNSPDEMWHLLNSGTDAISGFPDNRGWDLSGSYDPDPGSPGSSTRGGGFVDDAAAFDPGFFRISPREALAMDPQQRLLLEICWEAFEHAGIDPTSLRESTTGVFVGATASGYSDLGVTGDGAAGHLLTGNIASVISGRVSYTLGLEGPAVTVDTACSSSLVAMHLAASALRAGECSLALAGGVMLMIDQGGFLSFAQQGALAADGRSKPFSADADGMGLAEGAGVVVLERLSDARRNGHPVLAVVRGSAVNQDGASNGLTAPNGPSQQRVIRAALASAGLAAADVDVVEAHGTGTSLGDPIEAQAVLATYGRDRPADRPLWLGSVKSNLGHTQHAAGLAGVMKMVLALRHQELPVTLHATEPSAHIDWTMGDVRLLVEPVPWPAGDRPRRAGISSFGISGTNAHLIVEEPPLAQDPTAPTPSTSSVFDQDGESPASATAWLVSAPTTTGVAAQAERLVAHVSAHPEQDPADVGWSLASTRTRFEHRAVVLGATRGDLLDGLSAVAAGHPATGVRTGVATTPDPTVFVFPGQGSQWAGMGRELVRTSPVFAARLAECEQALDPYVDWSLSEVLAGGEGAPGLERVDVVQPALWAVMVSLAAVWQAAGVWPDAVVGHSQGEIAAAVIAGILTLDDAAQVVALRSQALTALSGHGGMLSIAESVDLVEVRLTVRPGVAVAAVNGPDATVVSGDLADLRELLGECERDGVRARLLPVDYASHGPQVEGIRGQVLGALSGIVPGPASVPMVSAMTGEHLAGPEADAEYWYASLRNSVQFDRAVRGLRQGGYGLFVEVSPHPVLTAAVETTLEGMVGTAGEARAGSAPIVVGTLRRDDGGVPRLLESLAELHVRGVVVDWPGVLVGGSRVELPTYAFERQRFWPVSLSGGAGDVRSAGLDSIGHPLLGAAVELADGDARVVTGRLSVRAQPWLGEHVVGGFPFFPGTGYVELAVVAGHLVGCTRVEELTLAAPLVLPPDAEVQVQITVGGPGQDGLREVEIYARPQDAGAGWVRYASGQIGPCGSPAEQDTTDFTVWPPSDATATDIGGLYEALAETGQDFGPAFQGLTAVWQRGEEVFAEVALPERIETDAAAYGLHPAILDAALQAVWMNGSADAGPRMPFAWSDVSLYAAGATRLRARLRRGPTGAASLLAVDGAGAPVISVGSLVLRPVTPPAPDTGHAFRDALFGVEWLPVPDAAPPTAATLPPEARWAVVGADSLGLVETLAAAGVEPEVYPELSALADSGGPAPGVVFAAVGTGGPAGDADQGRAARRLTNDVVALLRQWLNLDPLSETRLVMVTRGAVAALPGEAVTDLAAAAVWGLLRSAQTENPGRLVLMDLPAGPPVDLVGPLAGVLDAAEPELAIRAGRAYARRLVRPADLAPLAELPRRSGVVGTVLVTGGTGTLGGLTARHLAATGRARRVVLVSPSGPMAASTGAGPAVVAAAVAEAGVDVHVVAADTSDRAAVAALLAALPVGCPLTGVIHTAGIVDDGVVGSLTPERVDAVMRPKTDTAWNLHELTAGHPVEHFVMFSSTAAVFGGGGQGNYAAGNAFLDGLAAHRRAVGLPGLSLAWGAWVAEIGIGRNLSAGQLARVNSGGNFGAEEGLAALDLALTRDEALLVPSRLDVATLRVAASRGQTVPPLLQALSGPVRPAVSTAVNTAADTSAVHQQLARAPESERDRILTQLVRAQAAAVLGHSSPEAIEPARAFTELGFDSLTAVDLRNRLNQATGLRLPATLVFDYPNPAALSQHINHQLTGVLDDIVPTPHTAATTDDPIVIVGMGCRFPGGVRDPQELWELLAQGRDVVTPLPDDRGWDLDALYHPDPDNPGTCYARSGAFLHDSAEFDPDFFGISPREALAMDPQQRLLLETSWEAFERAGIDPTRLRGSQTGVFTGGSSWGYGAFGGDSEGHSMIGTSTSVMSGRVSYTLGLEGPAVTVDTACSSSLVAIHLAASALRAGECTLALAGGVTIMALPGALIGFSRQRGLAEDGRCKAFSASADGMGMGEGAAMILLERLSDARRNGHPVLAVVRGSAVNQDGASNGLTAPNGPSQQRVIRAALASAGLAAADVDVVEAHGTGTSLGDPIEAQAVLATYGRDRPADRPLWLGSVKTNLGHTQSAAGAAGVMKMVLALQHQELPVSLHADEPAHNIDWSAGHVELLAEARPWPVNGRPRRAGVSSFGISGTNAHLILEEPPPVGAPEPEGANGAEGRPAVLLDAPPAWPLSGRTAGVLAAQAGRLVAWVRGRDGVAPADVGWSLATARSAFEHRAVVLGSDLTELLSGATAVAEGESTATVLTGTVPAGRPARVGFLFAGQGAQRAGMGRQLYTASPVFAAAFDRAADLLEAELGLPIREVVLGAPEDDPGAVPDHGDDREAGRADQTVFAQTGLFALEVGLVAVLAEAGIVPDVVAGHSVGEIAAAHAAGVLSLEDACALVAARARLMQDLPPGGAMAAVAASEAEVLAELEGVPGVSLAAVNGPLSVVVSGEEVAVDELVRRWREQGRRVRRLRVSHAFHSALMDPALAELGTAAAGLEHRMPATSWVGALSGAPVEAPDAGYWTAQARQPVRFADAVKAMAELSVSVFIEIGPDGTLSGMASTALGDADPDAGESAEDCAEFIPLLRPNTPAATSVYAALGRAHVHGVSVDWTALLPVGRRVDLPTYAFSRRRFWIGTGMPAELPTGSRTGTTGEARFWAAVEGGDVRALADELAVEDRERLDGVLPMLASWRRREREDSVSAAWRYAISWARVPDPVAAVLSGVWLVVVYRAEQAEDHVRALTVHGAEPVVVEVARGQLDRASIAARVGQALDDLPTVTGVVSLLALEPEPLERHPVVAAGLAATVGLVQALGDLGVAAPLWVLTRGAVAAVEGEVLTAPMLAQVWGFGRVVGLEHPNRWGGLIDLPDVLDGRAAQRLCAVLAGAGPGFEDQVAIRGTGILGRRLVRAEPARGRDARWTPRGTVLVTGGSGALGGHAARWAAGRGADRIAVTSRSGANAPGVARLAADLAESGASVAVLAGDVGVRDDVAGLLRWVADSGPGLTAVLHAAGVAETTLVDQADLAGLAEVMAAKVGGAVWLDQLTVELDLAQFVVFSSISSTWGSGAQPGYAAGNAFLDALIENRRARGLAGASVAWGPWGGAGMAGSEETRTGLSSRGLRFLDGDRGIGALASVVDGGGGAVTVADVDWARFAEVFTLLRPSPLIADLPEVREVFSRAEPEPNAHETTALTHQLAGRSPAERDRIVTGLVRAEVAAVLGHESADEVDLVRPFSELGFDSLTAVELRNRLGSASGLRLASTVVFDCPTVSALAQHLLHQLEPASTRAPDTHRYVLSARVDRDAVSTLALGVLYQQAAGAGRADEAMALMTGLAAFRPKFSAIDELDNIPAPMTVARGPATFGMVCLPSFFGRSGPQEYARLAGRFQGVRSMSVLSEPGFREDEPLPASLADLVQVQVEALTRSLGDVSVVLLGHSSGGMVAHAVARHLEDIGRAPAGLVLLDTMSPPKNGLTGVNWSGLLDGALEHNSHDVEDTAWLTAMAHYYRFDWQEVGTSTVPTLQVWASDPIPGAMQITTHRSTWAYSRRAAAVEVPGDHFSMLGEHVATTAAAIEEWLTQL